MTKDNIHFTKLDPEDAHCCRFCQHSYVQMLGMFGKHFCNVRGDVGMNEDYNYIRPNDCEDYLSVWQNDYRRRRDLEREIKKKNEKSTK